MKNDADLPPEVVMLLHRALPSMVHIELLLLLFRTGPRAWTSHELALELRSSPELVQAAVADLHAARLAEREAGATPERHRFDASQTSAIHAVAGLQTIYDRKPVTLIKALYQRPSTGMQAFADAFRIRPEE